MKRMRMKRMRMKMMRMRRMRRMGIQAGGMAFVGHQLIRIGPTGGVPRVGFFKFPRAPSRNLSHQHLRPPKTNQ